MIVIKAKNIQTVPNQSVIEIVSDKRHRDKPYGIITEREQIWAARLLNDKSASHILYYYIALNQDGYSFALSPTAIHNIYGLSEKAYRTGIKKLKEVGYLVKRKEKSNILYFMRVPERYKNIDVYDWTPTQVLSVSSSPKSIDSIPLKGASSTPCGIDVLSPKVERNNTDNTYNINNIRENSYYDISNKCCPNEENDNEMVALKTERDSLIGVIFNKFGHLDNIASSMISAENKANQANGQRAILKEHIRLLSKIIDKMFEERSNRNNKTTAEYSNAIISTMPTDVIERMKVNMIFDKYIKEHTQIDENGRVKYCPIKLLREKYGVWIDGWNRDLQEPNFIVATYPLPLDILKTQHHNISDIPKSYWSNCL